MTIHKENKIPKFLFKRIFNSIKFGYRESLKEEDEFINFLPPKLKVDLLTYIYSKLVKDIVFLQKRNIEFMRMIYPNLRKMSMSKDEIIYFEGDHANELFFIKKGSVSFVIPQYEHFVFLTIEQGYFFGEIELIFDQANPVRKYTAITAQNSEFLVIN